MYLTEVLYVKYSYKVRRVQQKLKNCMCKTAQSLPVTHIIYKPFLALVTVSTAPNKLGKLIAM